MITVVGNLKGGTGKSTVAFNLALWLALKERPVRVCDLDPQGTLSDALEVRQEEGHTPLPELLAELPHDGPGDVIVDIGLSGMAAMYMALGRAKRILIPVAPSQADIWSTQRYLAMIENYISTSRRPQVLAFINRADTHPMARETSEAVEALNQLKGLKVLDARLGQRMAFRRSFSEGLAAFEMEPGSKAAEELHTLALSVFDGR